MCWVMPPASVVDDRRLADGVEQRRLAVVDVAHDRDHRRARLEVVGLVLERDLLVLLVGRMLDDHLALELARRSARPPRRSATCVVVHHVAEAIMKAMILAGETPSFSARSLTVIPDGTLTGPVGTSGSLLLLAGAEAPPSPLLPGLAAGLRVDHDPAAPAGAAPRCGRGWRAGCAAGLRRRHRRLLAEGAPRLFVVDHVWPRPAGGASAAAAARCRCLALLGSSSASPLRLNSSTRHSPPQPRPAVRDPQEP